MFGPRKRPSATLLSRCDLRRRLQECTFILELRLLRGNCPDQHTEDRLRDNVRDGVANLLRCRRCDASEADLGKHGGRVSVTRTPSNTLNNIYLKNLTYKMKKDMGCSEAYFSFYRCNKDAIDNFFAGKNKALHVKILKMLEDRSFESRR